MEIKATLTKITPYPNYEGYFTIHLEVGFSPFESTAVHKRVDILENYKLTDEQFDNLLN